MNQKNVFIHKDAVVESLEFKVLSLPSDIYFMSSVPVLLRWEYFLLVSVVTIILSLLSSLVPARLAARLHPVNAIRFS